MKRVIRIVNPYYGFEVVPASGSTENTFHSLPADTAGLVGGVGKYRIVRAKRGRFRFRERYPFSNFCHLFVRGHEVIGAGPWCKTGLAEYGLWDFNTDRGVAFNLVRVK